MTKLTNNAEGPRSVNTATGYVTLQKGQTVDVEISDADLQAIEDAGVLEGGSQGGAGANSGYPNLSPEAFGGASLQPMGTDQQAAGDRDSQIAALVDGNSKDKLVEIAKTEMGDEADVSGTKDEIAARIVDSRNA